MRYVDYHYKQSSLNNKDDLERCQFEILNEYGYNFGSEAKRNINQDNLFLKPKNIVNKDFINLKR